MQCKANKRKTTWYTHSRMAGAMDQVFYGAFLIAKRIDEDHLSFLHRERGQSPTTLYTFQWIFRSWFWFSLIQDRCTSLLHVQNNLFVEIKACWVKLVAMFGAPIYAAT